MKNIKLSRLNVYLHLFLIPSRPNHSFSTSALQQNICHSLPSLPHISYGSYTSSIPPSFFRNWKDCPVLTAPLLSLILLGFMCFTVLWETNSQTNRDKGWSIFNICSHLEQLFLLVPFSKINRRFRPSPWVSSASHHIVPFVSRPGNLPANPGLTWLCLQAGCHRSKQMAPSIFPLFILYKPKLSLLLAQKDCACHRCPFKSCEFYPSLEKWILAFMLCLRLICLWKNLTYLQLPASEMEDVAH